MELILGVVADAANKGEGSKLNVLGIFEDLYVSGLPCAVPHMALALSLRAAPHDRGKKFDVKIFFLDPDSKKLFEIASTLQITGNLQILEPVVPLALNLFNVALAKTGVHCFQVRVDKTIKGNIKLNVHLLAAPQTGGDDGGT